MFGQETTSDVDAEWLKASVTTVLQLEGAKLIQSRFLPIISLFIRRWLVLVKVRKFEKQIAFFRIIQKPNAGMTFLPLRLFLKPKAIIAGITENPATQFFFIHFFY